MGFCDRNDMVNIVYYFVGVKDTEGYESCELGIKDSHQVLP